MKVEVVVVGCGPAGLSAALYLGRAKISTLLVGKASDSQLVKAHCIENYFGFPDGIAGKDLLDLGIRQAERFGVTIVDGEVVDVDQTKSGFKVKTGKGDVHSAKVLVMATGTPIRLSGIKNEEELTSKGVHYCVECDGAFFQGKKVAIVGNGNHAADDAVDLLAFSKNVSIISNSDGFAFSPQMTAALKKHKIKLVDGKISEFVGSEKLQSVKLDSGKSLSFDGIFMACGTASALDFANKLALNVEKNILVVNPETNMTSVDGIFAAGNCCARCRQVAKNVGDGCNAALSVIRFLRRKELYFDYGPKK